MNKKCKSSHLRGVSDCQVERFFTLNHAATALKPFHFDLKWNDLWNGGRVESDLPPHPRLPPPRQPLPPPRHPKRCHSSSGGRSAKSCHSSSGRRAAKLHPTL